MRKRQKRLATALVSLTTALLALALLAPPAYASQDCDWETCSVSCYSGPCDIGCVADCDWHYCADGYSVTGCFLDE